ncbi:hypothetical protein ACFWJ5_33775 [Streptomyces qaidamensis]|uniref:hypothetical protein n=1 Tax=Streptomyces qaidamensis TaxID=1783515 RepID=UPI0036516138
MAPAAGAGPRPPGDGPPRPFVAADPTDRACVAQALAGTRLDTVAGRLDWTRGPAPNIALLPLVGGQWQHGPHGPRLAVVSNSAHPGVPLTGELTPAR